MLFMNAAIKRVFFFAVTLFFSGIRVSAQTGFTLPDIQVQDLLTRNSISIHNLPLNGKPKVVILTAQTKKDLILIGKLAELKDKGKTPLDALYVITGNQPPAEKLPGNLQNLNEADAATLEELKKYQVYMYKDFQGELSRFYKLSKTPLIFFLDDQNNIVYCHEKDNLSEDQVSNLNSQIKQKIITANANLYFDKTWFPVAKDNAVYYRNIQKKSATVYEVSDHFLNGKLQMKGTFTRVYPELKNGSFFYYTKEGTLDAESNYSDNLLSGIQKDYFPNGKVNSQYNCINNRIEGERQFFYETGEKYGTIFYKNGWEDGPMHFYYKDGKIKLDGENKNNLKYGIFKAYSPNHNILADLHYKDNIVDKDFPIHIYSVRGESLLFNYQDKANQKGEEPFLRSFLFKFPKDTILDVGEFKGNVADVYDLIYNNKSKKAFENKIFFYHLGIKQSNKTELISEFLFNAKNELTEFSTYHEGNVQYRFRFEKNILIEAWAYRSSGSKAMYYYRSDGKGIHAYDDNERELVMEGSDRINFFKKIPETDLFMIINQSTSANIQSLTSKLLYESFWLPESLINDFILLGAEWPY